MFDVVEISNWYQNFGFEIEISLAIARIPLLLDIILLVVSTKKLKSK